MNRGPSDSLTPITLKISQAFARRYEMPLSVERTEGLRPMEDLPLYRMAKRLLKKARNLRGREFPIRKIETPVHLDDWMEHRTPQFFLRNVPRLERSAPDAPEYDVVEVRDHEAEKALKEIRTMKYRPPEFIKEWNIERVVALRATLRKYIFEEQWNRRFCREIKEKIRGPLFKYDPDRAEE